MYSSQEWWNAAESATPGDPGDPIGQSLRFRGAQNLKRTFAGNGSDTRTVSFWMKKDVAATNLTHLITGGTGWTIELDDVNGTFGSVLNGIGIYDGSSHQMGNGSYRDPSAWYHVVVTTESTTAQIWVNGELMYSGGRNQVLFSDMTIGSYSDNTFYFDGHMADLYFIDGQALDPTAFGRYNEQDVWVPKKIDFGNALPKYSEMLYPASGGSLNYPDNAFDGEIINACYITPVDVGVTFRPTNEMEITSLEVYVSNNNMTATFGGVTTPTPTLTWTEIATSGTLGPNNPIVFDVSGGLNCNINGIKVNGEYLLDPYNWTSQLFTSPGYGSIDYNSTAQNFLSTAPIENGFDGQLNTFVQCETGNSWFFKPQGLTATKIEIQVTNAYGDPTGGAFVFNDVEQTGFPGQSWYTVYEGEPITGWTIGGWYRPDGSNGFAAIRVNGNILRNGSNPTYGPNGFHLDFSDRTFIGKDVSGNDNNFSNYGFNFDLVGLFSNMFDFPADFGGFEPGHPRQSMFDGSTATWAQVATDPPNQELPWEPTTPIAYTELAYYSYGAKWTLTQENGSVTTGGDNGTVGWVIIDSNPGTIKRLVFVNDSETGTAAVAAVRINGDTILTDNTGTDYDLMQDSPTRNFATLNPAACTPALIIEDANLSAGSGGPAGYPCAPTTIGPLDSGKWYVEFEITASQHIGVSNVVLNDNTPFDTYDDSLGWYPANQRVYRNSASGVVYGAIASSGTGAMALDLDNGTVEYFINGVSQGSATDATSVLTPDEKYYIQLAVQSGIPCSINYGQQPFLYPVPAGFEALQTQNLPSPEILDGREHFQSITGAIDAIFYNEQSISGSVQQPVVLTNPVPYNTTVGGNSFVIDLQESVTTVDVVWASAWSASVSIWCSNDGNTWTDTGQAGASMDVKYTYSISGAPFRYVRAWYGTHYGNGLRSVNSSSPILDQARDAFPTGLWWIKDRSNTNEHQLLDSVRGGDQALTLPTVAAQSAYVTPSGQSVAWCWNASDAWSSPAGTYGATLASSGQRDVDAGFSIIEYTGTSTWPQTIGHGLKEAPEFMIFRDYDSGQNTVVAGPGIMPVTSSILMNTDGGSFVTSGTFNNTAPTDKLITLGESNTVLTDDGGGYVCYAWHSVPGYSAFGTYPGTSDANKGPFIYTGFKPAFVMIKKINGSGNWFIYDNQLNQYNPCDNCLFPNTNSGEVNSPTNAGYPMDILSNGFKFYTYGAGLNEAGYDYLYAAFAENPFQLPVTAR